MDSKGLIGTDGRFKKSTASRAADSSLKAPVESNTLDACSSESAGISTAASMTPPAPRPRRLSVFGDDVVSITSKCRPGGGLRCSKALSVASAFGCATLRDSLPSAGATPTSVSTESTTKQLNVDLSASSNDALSAAVSTSSVEPEPPGALAMTVSGLTTLTYGNSLASATVAASAVFPLPVGPLTMHVM